MPFLEPKGESGNDDVAEHRDDEGRTHVACCVGDVSHQDRSDRTTDNAHDKVGGSLFRVDAYTSDGKGKDGGEHDALAEVAEEEGTDADGARSKEQQHHGECCTDSADAQ